MILQRFLALFLYFTLYSHAFRLNGAGRFFSYKILAKKSAMTEKIDAKPLLSKTLTEQQLKKNEALSGVLLQIERSYGKGSIQKLGETTAMNVATTPTGSMTLDIALGGGYPKGRVIEIYGPESSGKTTIALHAIAEIQKSGGNAAFIDVEHALDPVYAKNLGVDVDSLLICQPDSGEMALDIVEQLVRSSAVDMIIVDSVAALVPRAELEGDMQDQQMGLQARLMSKALRKITGCLAKSQTTVIFINQLRSKIGVMFGNPEVTAGGNALKFYSSVRIDIRKKEVIKDNQGVVVRCKVVKNKVAPPFRLTEFDILFGSGIDTLGCILDAAESVGVVQRKGAWYYHGSDQLAQGRRPSIEFLKSNPELKKTIEQEVRKILKSRSHTVIDGDPTGTNPAIACSNTSKKKSSASGSFNENGELIEEDGESMSDESDSNESE